MSAIEAGYSYPIRLFERTGVELEYMIVDRETLDVRPIADELIRAECGSFESEIEPEGVEGGAGIAWSNELALHVVELKTAGPAASLDGLAGAFEAHVRRINERLSGMGAMLLPGAMHPWMDPHSEMRLWPHEHNAVYEAFDRIFSCRGHGWANLQSAHINLPFGDDEEFGRLHAAIRLVLPLLPALAASSPVVDGEWTSIADNRLEVYRTNAARVASVAGLIVPEPVFTREAYEGEILGRIYRDLAGFDPDGVLRHEWANSRGCIARFDRGAIEIRLLDVQECPRADVAVCTLVREVVRAHVEERWIPYEQQREIATEPLHEVLLETIRHAEHTRIRERSLLEAYGIGTSIAWAGDVWRRLGEQAVPPDLAGASDITALLGAGTLASRIRARLRRFPTRRELRDVYAELASCLGEGRMFLV